MSDTVKLIVEIPKEDFNKLVNPYQHNEIWCNRLKRMVMNGIPLDDIKKEIETELSWNMFDEYGNETSLHKELMEILDNVGKTEEETFKDMFENVDELREKKEGGFR